MNFSWASESDNSKNPVCSIIILTYNEEIHIERCIRSIQPIAKQIFVVDSYSTDRTVEIAELLGAKVAYSARS